MGGPGSGKGTQARLLEEVLGIIQIASGDLFREQMKDQTELGQLAEKFIDVGDLVPDDVTISMIAERVSRSDCTIGAVLDGFPRTIAQALALETIAADLKTRISVVPCIDLPLEILLRRLAGRWTCRQNGHVYHDVYKQPIDAGICDIDGSELYQREDDTEETQKHRIRVYRQRTTPLIKYYDERGMLVRIEGDQSIEQVHQALVATIAEAETLLVNK